MVKALKETEIQFSQGGDGACHYDDDVKRGFYNLSKKRGPRMTLALVNRYIDG